VLITNSACRKDPLDDGSALSSLKGLSPKVKLALQFLEEGLCEGVTLAGAAGYVKMNPASLNRKLHEELRERGFSVSIREYLDLLRVKKAKELFRSDPTLESKEVASKVGLGYRSFTQVFKRHTGMTPHAYRNHVS
jgi:two-component system response regulator YesN